MEKLMFTSLEWSFLIQQKIVMNGKIIEKVVIKVIACMSSLYIQIKQIFDLVNLVDKKGPSSHYI